MLSLTLTLAGIALALRADPSTVGVAIVFASLGLLASKLWRLAQTEATLQRSFREVSKANFGKGLAAALLVMSYVRKVV